MKRRESGRRNERQAGCIARVGRIRRAHAPHGVGCVISQSPKPGARRAAGTRVNLVVGRP